MSVVISMHDRGRGVNDQELKNAMIPFYSTKKNGTGLGLALCREIVEALYGHIGLQNRDGGGLVVRIHLPVYQT